MAKPQQDRGLQFEDLLKLIDLGINNRKNQTGFGNILLSCYNGGNYRGAPGRDVYFCLPRLSTEQIKVSAYKLADRYDKAPIGNNLGYAACFRFVFGMWNRNGSLMSDNEWKSAVDRSSFNKYKKTTVYKMISKPKGWILSYKFMDHVIKRLKRNNNYYGLTVAYEMYAHRLGDEAVITGSKKKFVLMKKYYRKAYKNAMASNSWKHKFSPSYWAARYSMKFGNKKTAVLYCRKTLIRGCTCTDGRDSVLSKFYECLLYLQKEDKNVKEFLFCLKNRKSSRVFRKACQSIHIS